jgi:hypothetical protein
MENLKFENFNNCRNFIWFMHCSKIKGFNAFGQSMIMAVRVAVWKQKHQDDPFVVIVEQRPLKIVLL